MLTPEYTHALLGFTNVGTRYTNADTRMHSFKHQDTKIH